MREVKINDINVDSLSTEQILGLIEDLKARLESKINRAKLEADLDKMPQFKIDTERTDND